MNTAVKKGYIPARLKPGEKPVSAVTNRRINNYAAKETINIRSAKLMHWVMLFDNLVEKCLFALVALVTVSA